MNKMNDKASHVCIVAELDLDSCKVRNSEGGMACVRTHDSGVSYAMRHVFATCATIAEVARRLWTGIALAGHCARRDVLCLIRRVFSACCVV